MNKKYIRELLRLNNITVKQYANSLNVTMSNAYLRLSGKKTYTIYEGKILSELLNMSLNDIFSPTSEQLKKVLVEGKLP